MRRAVLVLALLAALLGPPPAASAAANRLPSPHVLRATGTTSTVLVLGVSYDGRFPATGVQAPGGGNGIAWGALLLAIAAVLLTAGLWRRRPTGDRSSEEHPADETAALLVRRARRRARTILDDDPIVISMGLDADAPARRDAARRPRGREPDGD